MAGFLRRLRRRSETAEEAGTEETPPTEGSDAGAPETGRSSEIGGDEAAAAPTPAPAAEAGPTPPAGPEPAVEPLSIPPPLPEADQEAARGSLGRRGAHLACFLCGSPLEGPWCPTCRMAWAE